MLLTLTKFIGWILSRMPEALLRLFSWGLGSLLYYVYGSRRRMMLRNIALSFPDKPRAWHCWVGKTSCIRLIETSLLSLASPYFSEERIQKMATATASCKTVFQNIKGHGKGLVVGTAHLAYWEGLTWMKRLVPEIEDVELLTIFRPLRSPDLDAWLKQTRERFGVRLMSRNGGLHQAAHVLQRKGMVALLFDQSAGSHGYLTHFFGRECSTTPLPGMLVERSGAEVALVFARRTGFWRFDVEAIPVQQDGTEKGVTIALNAAFEQRMREDEELCASWLWLHKRWRILDRPGERQKIIDKRGGLIS